MKTSKTIMKFSAPDWCFAAKAGCDAAGYYGRLREIGYDAVEMVAPARRPAAMAAGLNILNLAGPGMTEGLNRKEHHAALIPQLREAVEEAAATGVQAVIVFSGNRAGQFDSEGLCNCRTGLDALLPLAAARGVELHLEAFNVYDHADYQADSLRYARIVKASVQAGYAGHWGMEFLPQGDVFAELAQARTLFLKYAGQTAGGA